MAVVRNAFQVMVGIGHRDGGLGLLLSRPLVAAQAAAPLEVVLPSRRPRRPGLARCPDRGLDHDRGRAPAVGRLQGDANRGGRDRGRRDTRRLRDAGRSSTWDWSSSSPSCCDDSHAPPSPCRLRTTGRTPDAARTGRCADALRPDRLRGVRRRRLRRGLLGSDRRRRRARLASARLGQAVDGPGLGGKPRLADLRPRRHVDRVPVGVRGDHEHALRAPVRRHGRDRLPRHARSRCAARPRRSRRPG